MRLLVASATVCLILAGTAQARDHTTQTVSTSGFDLSNPRDVRLFYQRLMEAAAEVCDVPSKTSLGFVRADPCFRDTLGEAVERARSPALTAFHAGRASAGGLDPERALMASRDPVLLAGRATPAR